jgi:hypothetical protein
MVRCKLRLLSIRQTMMNNYEKDGDPTAPYIDKDGLPQFNLSFGAVWEGSTEKQAMSENAIFGKWTPVASFEAMIKNEAAIKQLEQGKCYYFDIHEAPEPTV